MGQRDFSADRSKRKEQNLHQMIQVLHSRLAALEAAVQARKKACEDDLAATSERQPTHVSAILLRVSAMYFRGFCDRCATAHDV